jgi:pyruvate/2-oxoglutarate dehydrogenase complex dihydrolipoamide dehydrogenase (E3) component
LRALGVEIKYISGLGGFVPLHDENLETSKRGVYVAGDITGIEEANTAMDEGRLVGVAVAEKLGRVDRSKTEELKSDIRRRLADLRIGSYGRQRAEGKQEVLAALRERKGT